MPFKSVASLDAFLRHPLGRLHVGTTYAAWCASPRLVGMSSFGHRTEDQAAEVTRVFTVMLHPSLRAPIKVLLDYRRMEGVAPGAFKQLAGFLAQMAGPFTERLDKVVMLLAPTQVGASLAGTAALSGYAPRLVTVYTAEHAVEALGDAAALQALADVEHLLDAREGSTAPVTALRARLRVSPVDARLPRLAVDIGVSVRTLQRALAEAGTTFTREVQAARVAFAAHALTHGTDKVEHVARAAGCSSASQLSVLFRRHMGMTPGEYRDRHATR